MEQDQMPVYKMYVKEKTVDQFLRDNLLTEKSQEVFGGFRDHPGMITPMYSILKDDILMKKSSSLVSGDKIKIEIISTESITKNELVNEYIYEAEDYDSIAIKLKLQSFNVRPRVKEDTE